MVIRKVNDKAKRANMWMKTADGPPRSKSCALIYGVSMRNMIVQVMARPRYQPTVFYRSYRDTEFPASLTLVEPNATPTIFVYRE